MSSYETIKNNGDTMSLKPVDIYRPFLRSAHALNYSEDSKTFEEWHLGRQWIAQMLNRSMQISRELRGQGVELDPWGFKHPRTSLLLPLWQSVLRDKFVFIHVIRDGKDIVAGDNQRVFHDECSDFYGTTCAESLGSKLNFWAEMVSELLCACHEICY